MYRNNFPAQKFYMPLSRLVNETKSNAYITYLNTINLYYVGKLRKVGKTRKIISRSINNYLEIRIF